MMNGMVAIVVVFLMDHIGIQWEHIYIYVYFNIMYIYIYMYIRK